MSMMGTAWLLFLISLTLRGFAPHRAGPWLWTTSADIAGFVVMLLGAWRGANLVYHSGSESTAPERPWIGGTIRATAR